VSFTTLDYTPHAERCDVLARGLSARLDAPVSVRFWREGADYGTYLVTGGGPSSTVLRVPHLEHAVSSYDGEVHYAELVAKEVAVHTLLHDSGIPVPAVLDHDTTRQYVPWSWMLVERVLHDDAGALDDAQQRRLGELAAAIHAVGVPAAGAGAIPSPADWTAFVGDRLLRRLGELDAYATLPGDRERWAELVARHAGPLPAGERRLLHMDLRASNLCLRDGEVVAVLDMTNAMFGSPLLELGRIQAYGLLTPAFLEGYGSVRPGFARPRDQIALYALDSASMLALLAREELADEAMFAEKLRFTEQTLELLLAGG
jgi:aminoglycoside phosphotransferase (APT) family kinase protein